MGPHRTQRKHAKSSGVGGWGECAPLLWVGIHPGAFA
jgi:hypothetical protein